MARRLVLLDAWVGNDGESLHSRAGERLATINRARAERGGAGWRISPLRPDQLGVTDPADAEWLAARLTDQPLRSFEEPTRLTGAANEIETYAIVCVPGAGIPYGDWAREFGWPVSELPTGHDAMVTAPAALARLLLAAG